MIGQPAPQHRRRRAACAEVRGEVVEGAQDRADASDAGTLESERRRRDVPAAVLFAQQVRGGYGDVVEVRLVEPGAPRHLLDRRVADAGRLHVDEQVRDALMLRRLRVGAREDVDPVRVGRA